MGTARRWHRSHRHPTQTMDPRSGHYHEQDLGLSFRVINFCVLRVRQRLVRSGHKFLLESHRVITFFVLRVFRHWAVALKAFCCSTGTPGTGVANLLANLFFANRTRGVITCNGSGAFLHQEKHSSRIKLLSHGRRSHNRINKRCQR